MNTSKFLAIWGISSVVMLTLLLGCVAGWTDGLNNWFFHSNLGGFFFVFGFAVLAIGALRDILRLIVRLILKLL